MLVVVRLNFDFHADQFALS